MSSVFCSLYFCAFYMHTLLIFRSASLSICVTVRLSLYQKLVHAFFVHPITTHTANTIALVSRSSSFFSTHFTSLFGLPASVRAYLVTFVELDAFPSNSLSFPFPFSWSRVFDDCSITTASHHIVHTIIRSFRRHSFSTLFPGWFWMHLCGLYHVVGWK